jgi:hypothetical protein
MWEEDRFGSSGALPIATIRSVAVAVADEDVIVKDGDGIRRA